jgi:O-methyltransferase involved in polyketide biosynthesis
MSKALMKTSKEALDCKVSSLINIDNNSIFNYANKDVKIFRQNPLLNVFYFVRTVVVHKLVDCFVSDNINSKDSTQLIILGAGLDSSYEIYDTSVFAVDFEDVILERTKIKETHNEDIKYVRYIDADLRDLKILFNKLQLNKVDFSKETIILLECVACYLEQNYYDALLFELNKAFARVLLAIYDPVLEATGKNNGFSSRMRNKFEERNAPLKTCFNNIVEKNSSLYALQWKHVDSFNMQQCLRTFFSSTQQSKLFRQARSETFDEYNSLAQLFQHYFVSIASNCTFLFSKFKKKLFAWMMEHEQKNLNNNNLKLSVKTNIKEDKCVTTKKTNEKIQHYHIINALKTRVEVLNLKLNYLESKIIAKKNSLNKNEKIKQVHFCLF